MLKTYIKHARDREYMSGVERDHLRVKQTAEVFTPTHIVIEMLDRLEEQDATIFTDPSKTFIDHACGDGQFLTEVVIRKMERGSTLLQALSTTYGVELMEDNVALCRQRLAGPNPTPEILEIVNRNIECRNALLPKPKQALFEWTTDLT